MHDTSNDPERKLRERLKRFLPPGTEKTIARWMVEEQVHVRINKSRSSRSGDFFHAPGGQPRITINIDLDQFSFLVTLVHEFAHLHAHKNYSTGFWRRRIDPHGREWKQEYRKLMNEFFGSGVFPPELEEVLTKHFVDPSATACSDIHLERVLLKYSGKISMLTLLADLKPGQIFKLPDGRLFRLEHKMRKNYSCTHLKDGRLFSIGGAMQVMIVEPADMSMVQG